MPEGFAVELIMRWIHILSAVTAVGGTIFIMLVLQPAISKGIPKSDQEAFRTLIMKRWKLIVHSLIVFFLFSGFYNYIVITSGRHEGQSLYHALFGVKFLLALVFFFFVIVGTSTMKWSARFRENKAVSALMLIAALALVLLGGFMKTLPVSETTDEEQAVEQTEP